MPFIPRSAWHGVWVGAVAALVADIFVAVLKKLNVSLPSFGG